MTEFDHTPTDPPAQRTDPSVDDLPGEADETDVERGSADGSAPHNEVLDDSLDRAGARTDVDTTPDATTDDEDPSAG